MSKKQIPVKSKLFSLRKWLTLPEAGQYLSILFDEEVGEAEVLRLVLDGQLRLSVNFVNQVYGQRGQLYSYGDEENYPPDLVPAIPMLMGRFPFEGKILDLGTDLLETQGVWDLSMVDGQKYFIEKLFQMCTGGPEVIYPHSGDAWFIREGGQVLRLFERVEEDGIEQGDKEADDFYYYLANADYLPDDSVLVVRPQALVELQELLSQEFSKKKPALDSRSERTYLNIIGALLEVVTGTFKDKSFQSETQLRDFIAKKFDGLRGVSTRTLAEKFALAKKVLNEELD